MHFEGNKQIITANMTLWPGMSLTALKGEIKATVYPHNVHKIEVQWGEEPRDPNPTRITEENCAEKTRDLSQRQKRDVKDTLVVYYSRVGDAQSGEDREDTAAEYEAICPKCHSTVVYQME